MKEKTVEEITYEEAKSKALEIMSIKNHDCVFVDFKNAFGYSVLVFKNGRHIHYANDYELHHHRLMEGQGREGLRKFYVVEMESKLFTEGELLAGISTYDEYKRKDYFLRNYWIMRYDHVSAFVIGKKQKEELKLAKRDFPFFSPVSFCYVNDNTVVKKQMEYQKYLQKAFKMLLEDTETFREMVHTELINHEAGITCSYEETLQALGLSYEKLTTIQKSIVNSELKIIALY